VKPARVRVIAGDARELPGIRADSVHLVVTSPPYPMIPQWDELFRRMRAVSYASMHARLAEAWRACYRVLVPGGILAVNIGDALRSEPPDGFRLWPNHAELLRRCIAVGFRPLPYVLWKKPMNRPNAFLGSGFLPPNAYVTLDCEFVLLFRKGGLRRFPRADPTRRSSRYTRPERDRWFSQLWEVRAVRQEAQDGRRRAAFPEEIPRRLIRMFSVRGDTVLDPFAGTGTTLRVARRLGRNAIGVEIDPSLAATIRREFTRSGSPSEAVPGVRGASRGRGVRPRRRA
jgi:modification methylase